MISFQTTLYEPRKMCGKQAWYAYVFGRGIFLIQKRPIVESKDSSKEPKSAYESVIHDLAKFNLCKHHTKYFLEHCKFKLVLNGIEIYDYAETKYYECEDANTLVYYMAQAKQHARSRRK